MKFSNYKYRKIEGLREDFEIMKIENLKDKARII